MFRNSWPNLAMLTAGLTASATIAQAHEIVGNRFFPATLAIDDPGVNDEVAFPTIACRKPATIHRSSNSTSPGEFSKRITEDFAVSFAPTWSRLYAPGGPAMNGARGFQKSGDDVQVPAVQKLRA